MWLRNIGTVNLILTHLFWNFTASGVIWIWSTFWQISQSYPTIKTKQTLGLADLSESAPNSDNNWWRQVSNQRFWAEYSCSCAQLTHTLCGCAYTVRRGWARQFFRKCVVCVRVGKYQVCDVRKIAIHKNLKIWIVCNDPHCFQQ